MNDKYLDIIKNLDPSIKMILDKIRRFLMAGKASVMIGSGFSMNAESDGTGQMRTWDALNVDLFKSLYGRVPTEKELDTYSPIRLAAQVESAHGEKELDEIIMNALPDKSVYPGVLHKKLMKLHWRDIFTTNYDTLLERSSEDSGTAYTLVTNKETLLYSKSPRIIKLHGSFPDVRPFIMSEEAFRTYPHKYPEFVNTVRQSLIENLFCLIGFSGNDPNFLSWQGWIRDVMGEQMTNAILVDYKEKPNKLHDSEKKLFASRKIDILNLGEIQGLESYKEALDFFLSYIGMKEQETSWNVPSFHSVILGKEVKKVSNFEEDIKKLTDARESYPGWVFLKDSYISGSVIERFPFLGEYYKKLPDKLKIDFLFNLDWLLDISLYPKTADWYIEALQDVKAKFAIFKGKDKEEACQLIVSLFSVYRELRQIDEYLSILSFIEENCIDMLSTKQKSIFFYEQCLWNLSILDYKDVYTILLKWKLQDNDFIGALWQASIYRELGDNKIAEDLLLSYYSRLTTKMLMDNKSAFLSSCKQLYTFVISRTIGKQRLDFDIADDNYVYRVKKELIQKAQQEQPNKTETHGFNLGQITNTTHLRQGGFVNAYLYSERYLLLTNLHGCTVNKSNATEATDYATILKYVSKYHFYEAVARLVRSGYGNSVGEIVNREALSRVGNEEIGIIFTAIFEMAKDNIVETNKRKKQIAEDLLIPILQRLCTKVDDECLDEFFDFIIENASNSRLERNSILKTIYECATEEQRKRMLQRVLEHPITVDSSYNDILLPDCGPAIDVTEKVYEEATKNINNKHHKIHSYNRILTLLQCTISKEQKDKLEACIMDWRMSGAKDVNAFFSYHVVPATNDADREIEKRWKNETIKSFLEKDFSDTTTSESIMNFSHAVDCVVPALDSLTAELTEKIVEKITEALYCHRDLLTKDDGDELFGGFRQFSTYMFDVLDRVFRLINFDFVSSKLRDSLVKILLDLYEAKNPCLLLLCIVDNKTDKCTYAKTANNRQFDGDSKCRFDARNSLYYLFTKYPDEFKPIKVYGFVRKNAFFMEYSHSRTLSEHLKFISELIATGLLDDDGAEEFCEPLLTIFNEIQEYEMPFDYKIDIAHAACELAGAISTKETEKKVGVLRWKEVSENPDEFRDVRSGFSKGVRKCVGKQ